MAQGKNTSYTLSTSVGFCRLTESQFKEIQSAGQTILSPPLRERLQEALFWYPLESNAADSTDSPEEQSRNLVKALESLEFLQTFFDQKSEDHSLYGPFMRVKDELYITSDAPGIESDEQEDICTAVDIKRFQEELGLLSAATKRAIDLPISSEEKEAPALDLLIGELKDIYDQSQGKKGAEERFMLAAINTLPEHIRPILPRGYRSIYRKAKRLKDKQKSN